MGVFPHIFYINKMRNHLPYKLLITFFFSLFLFLPISALEYGGLGGKPAYPISQNERSKSIFIYNLDNGDSKDDGVQVINNTEETKEILVYSTDSERSSDGSFACKQYADDKKEVGSWIDLEETIILDSRQTEIVDFTITIPDNASVGEHNGCIMIQEKELNKTTSGASISFRTGLRVAVTIPGEQVRELTFNDYELSVKENGLLGAKVDIENKGNVSIDTNIILETSYIFGIRDNEVRNQYPIFRGETSTFNFELPKPFWGGLITVNARAEYDKSANAGIGVETNSPKSEIVGGSQTVFSFPDPVALVIEVIVLIVILGIIFTIYRKLKFKRSVKNTWRNYIVKEGDNINLIAQNYGISWKSLAKVNKLQAPYLLNRGDTLKVPSSDRNL